MSLIESQKFAKDQYLKISTENKELKDKNQKRKENYESLNELRQRDLAKLDQL